MSPTARALTLILAPLAAIAAAGGLLVPDLYRDNAFGLLAYLAHTYTGAVFAYQLNRLFLVHVAAFSLAGFALVAAARGLDAAELARAAERVPRRATIGVLVALAPLLAALWLGQLVPFLVDGAIPEGVRLSDGGILFVHVLDLGVVVPVAVLAAVGLHRGRAWGVVLAGCALVEMATMGLALVSMTAFAARAGIATDAGLPVAWVAIAATGLGMSAWFLARVQRGSSSTDSIAKRANSRISPSTTQAPTTSCGTSSPPISR